MFGHTLLGYIPLALGLACCLLPSGGTAGDKGKLNNALLAAVRDGDATVVRELLARGADVDARDEGGATALMQAALNADVAMMQVLLTDGADVNARNKAQTPALLWALHEPGKVKLLLDRGAVVPDEAVFLAAGLAGSRPTLQLLADKGAKLNASRQGYTPLMAAIYGGDRDTIGYLLEQGVDLKAKTRSGYTALYAAAARPGNADLVGLLLEKGADPNARVQITEPAADLFTPLLVAALHGDAKTVQLLLDRGADANVQGGAFGRTALLGAATAASADAVQLLLASGADVNAKDHLGNTPLQWAKRRGETDVVKVLEKAGATEPTAPRPAPEPERLHKAIDAGSAKRAVAQGLALLQQSAEAFTTRKGCVSCHHQLLPALAVGSASTRGIEVDEKIAAGERAAVRSTLEKNREKMLQGDGVTDDLVPAYALVALAAEGGKPDALTDALVHFLTLRQKKEGCWQTPVYRPPHDASNFTFTALAVRGLQRYAPKGRGKEVEGRVARARDWLVGTPPRETEDRAFRLLGLAWAKADRSHVREATGELLREQREDGGWAQLPTLKSDAYATGQVLFALHEGGGLPADHPAYRRGVEFLLKTQWADGSWFVPTRSFPIQPFVGARFPHGRSQFISAAATGWATLALSLTVPPREARERQSGGG
jgi:ankyrin repeat protein